MYRASSRQLVSRALPALLTLLVALGLASVAGAQTPARTPGTPAPGPGEPGEPASRPAPIDIHGGAVAPASRPTVSPQGPTPGPTPVPAPRPRVKAPKKPLPPPAVRALRRHPAIGRRFFIGVGFSLGFFWPPDVNGYIQGYKDSLGPTLDESGTTTMFVNLVPRIAIAMNIGRYAQVAALGEIGWAPKVVSETNSGNSEVFHFVRYSGGLMFTANLPLSPLRGDSLFAGVAPMVHHMRFEGFEKTAFGIRGVAGYRFYEGILLIDAFMAVDVVKGDTGRPIGFGNQSSMVLNYSGVLFGATVYFGVL
jgi:hypothetical protein